MSPIDRRTLLQRLMVLAGAAALAPAFSLDVLAADTSPRLLNAAHFALLSAVTDTMIPVTDTPGAIAAGVPRAFDSLLRNWASPERRTALIGALKAIDSASKENEKQPFARLSPTKRRALLTAYDASALKAGASNPGRTSFLTEPNVVNPAYAKLKELVVALFYLSKVGLTNELAYEHTPGSWGPSIPVTPQTRPMGGPSLI